MDKMKEELRLVIAFALAVMIIMVFGRTQGGRQKPQTVMPEKSPVAVRGEEQPNAGKPFPPAPEPEAVGGEEKTYEDSRYIMKIDTAGGLIKNIGLKEYTRKDETYLAIFENSDLLLSYTADDTHAPDLYTVVQDTPNFIELKASARSTVIEKAIEVPEDSYTFTSNITIRNTGGETVNLKNYVVDAGKIDLATTRTSRATRMEFAPPEIVFNTDGKIVRYNMRVRDASYENTAWIAVKQKYGLLFIRPETPSKSFVSSENGHLRIGFMYDAIAINPGATEKLGYSFYAGPSDYFVASKEIPEKSIFGTGFFAAMGRFLFTALSFIHRVIPNWGWAIILLTLIVKIVFFPLTQKSLKSMKAMQKLRPYLQDIQKKYKGNPQQMQKELMNLYKEYNINPFGGCLPMLIQFPIFIGFFIALRNSVFLRGASFGLWITDLSRPDTITRIGDFNVNLLPIMMAVTSFWQQKLTPQEPSQKALVYMMPVMFLFLFYNFSSGLLLYWITMNAAGLVEQYFVHKK